ncbi:cystathionine beta-synthase-like [Maniola hyperantus]|uniref:cystathionine beta-synthase-like n=1 Tax=Aphantopus hyperantus TaxID=2795564 RepID=UPI002142FF9F
MENGATNGNSSEFFNLKEMPHIIKPLDRKQKVYENILSVIGDTPLVKLSKIPKEEGVQCQMYAKCEFVSPGGSVKDRIAYRMVQDAERRGVLIPGKSVIIEPTSGNTGIGLALASAVKGYRCIIVLPEKMSDEKVNTLLALGAEIIRTPTEAASDSPEGNLLVARRLSKEIPNAVLLDQYNNVCNPLAHYDGTAEEILWSLDDDVDMVVIGAGTCGTISGVAHKIKERCPKCVVVGVDPVGSILAEPEELNVSDVQMYEVEGIGYDFLPRTLDRKVIDKWIKTNDCCALQMSRRLIKEEGLLCGGSSGAVMSAAIKAAKQLKAGQKCVVLLPDNIRNYMTKFISDQWMEARNFKPIPNNDELWWWNKPLLENMVPTTVSISLNSSPSDAIAALRKSGSPLVTVVDNKGCLTGVFTADNTRKRLANIPGSSKDGLEKLVVKKIYKVDLSNNPTLGAVSRMLDIAPYVVVVKTESSQNTPKVIGAITSDDLLIFISSNQPSTTTAESVSAKIQNGNVASPGKKSPKSSSDNVQAVKANSSIPV